MLISKTWDFGTKDQILGLELADLDGDGRNEIIAFSKFGRLYFLSLDGKLLSKVEVSKDSPIWNLKIADIIKDGSNYMITGGLDGLLRVFKIKRSLELIPKWVHQFGSSISGFICDDVNYDGITEVIAYSLDRSIRVLSPDNGFLIWGQVFENGIGDALTCHAGNRKIIFAAGNDGTIRSFDGNKGSLLNFVRFTDKMRSVIHFKFGKKDLIICGGDDRKAHFLKCNLQSEIKTLIFENILWKIYKYQNSVILSSYTFDFLNNNYSKENFSFSSKIVCIDKNLDLKWELREVNNEVFIPYEKYGFFGTTNGILKIVKICSGEITYEMDTFSCVNDLCYEPNLNQIYSCHDNGFIKAYNIEK